MNYLAIGNSITTHGVCSYWWSKIGMAASDVEHDYYHIVKKYIDSHYMGRNIIKCFNYYAWEVQGLDRDETFSLLDGVMDFSPKLITIQLGENVSDVATYYDDFLSLIEHIKSCCPRSRVFIIGDFWYSEQRGEIKKDIAIKTSSVYIDLKKLQLDKKYMCGLGTKVYGADGRFHIVEHNGVAQHPNDYAMEYIAKKIISRIKLCGI